MKNFSSKTKVSYRRNSKKSWPVRIGIGIFAALLVLYFFGTTLGFIGSFITTPFFIAKHWTVAAVDTIPRYLGNRAELIAEIHSLEEQLSARSDVNASLAHLISENEALRALMSATEEDRIVASVIAQPPGIPYDSMLLDRGYNDGIKEGAIVYHTDDRAIGFVSRTFRKSALVTLFSTPDVETTAYIAGPNIYTKAYGEGGGVIRISVPQGIAIGVEDVVVLPSLTIGILGMIQEIESIPTEPEQHGYVLQDFSLQSLRFVSVSSRVIETITFEEAEEIIRQNNYSALLIDVPEEIIVDTEFGTTSLEVSTTTEEREDASDEPEETDAREDSEAEEAL